MSVDTIDLKQFRKCIWKAVNPIRIGQLVITPVVIADFVTELGEQRGTGAFGSTGK